MHPALVPLRPHKLCCLQAASPAIPAPPATALPHVQPLHTTSCHAIHFTTIHTSCVKCRPHLRHLRHPVAPVGPCPNPACTPALTPSRLTDLAAVAGGRRIQEGAMHPLPRLHPQGHPPPLPRPRQRLALPVRPCAPTRRPALRQQLPRRCQQLRPPPPQAPQSSTRYCEGGTKPSGVWFWRRM